MLLIAQICVIMYMRGFFHLVFQPQPTTYFRRATYVMQTANPGNTFSERVKPLLLLRLWYYLMYRLLTNSFLKQLILRQNGYQTVPFGVYIHNLMLVFIGVSVFMILPLVCISYLQLTISFLKQKILDQTRQNLPWFYSALLDSTTVCHVSTWLFLIQLDYTTLYHIMSLSAYFCTMNNVVRMPECTNVYHIWDICMVSTSAMPLSKFWITLVGPCALLFCCTMPCLGCRHVSFWFLLCIT